MSDLDIFKDYVLCTAEHCSLRLRKPKLYGDVKSSYEKIIIFLSRQISYTGYKFNRNTGKLNKLSVVHFKGSAQLTQFPPLLNINCTEPYLGPLYRSYVLVQILNRKIPERVLLNGAICKRFSKVSHR